MVVNQSIWFEGEAKFADVILPACTNFERTDISEWAGLGGYGHHGQQQLNHRVIVFQAPAIEPLGESKSDYWIFNEMLQAARARQLLLGGLQRARLGEAHLSRLRPAEGDLVQEAPQARLLRRAGREGEAARAGVVPLVLGEPQEGRAGGAAAAVRLHRGIPARAADAVRQARIRVQQPQARQRSGTTADRQIRAGGGGDPLAGFRALSAADADAALEVFVPHPGRRQGLVPAQHRRPSCQRRRLLLLDHAHERRRTPRRAASRSTTWSRSTTSAARSSARLCRRSGCRAASATATSCRRCTTRWASPASRSTAAAASTC